MATIDVVLLKSIKKSGRTAHAGDVISVSLGYFRYLYKEGMARRSSGEILRELEARQQVLRDRDEAERERAHALLEKVSDAVLEVTREASDNDVLYGAVTVSDIAHLLQERGVDVPRSSITIPVPIKKLGSHAVTVMLHPKVLASLIVKVLRAS